MPPRSSRSIDPASLLPISQRFLQKLSESITRRVVDPFAAPTTYDWRRICRPSQLPPDVPYAIWLLRTGRGWGKTRTLAEWCREQVFVKKRRRGALVSSTKSAVRRVMVEGISGILAVCPPEQRPIWTPSKGELYFPQTGCLITCYSAESPEDMRGPEHDFAWADEVDSWAYDGPHSSPQKAFDAWDNLELGLRLGTDPQMGVSSTPKPGRIVAKIIKRMLKIGDVQMTTGSTYENEKNLAPSFLKKVLANYAGTIAERQELYGELIEEAEGALWKMEWLDASRVHPDLAPETRSRVGVAVDPAVSAKRGSSETGIVGGFQGPDGHLYVTDDKSLRGKPDVWGTAAVGLYFASQADIIYGEVNNGGDLVESQVRAMSERFINYVAVHASRGKAVRSEPVAGLWQQKRAHLVGSFPLLELQMLAVTTEGYIPPDEMGLDPSPSPDRVDALTWLAHGLILASSEVPSAIF